MSADVLFDGTMLVQISQEWLLAKQSLSDFDAYEAIYIGWFYSKAGWRRCWWVYCQYCDFFVFIIWLYFRYWRRRRSPSSADSISTTQKQLYIFANPGRAKLLKDCIPRIVWNSKKRLRIFCFFMPLATAIQHRPSSTKEKQNFVRLCRKTQDSMPW